MFLPENINGKLVNVLLDTGARKNYISLTKANKLRLNIIKAKNKINVELGNRSYAHIIETSEVVLTLKHFPAHKFSESLTVINESLSKILLSSPFLDRQDMMIDYRERQLRIVNHVLSLN